MSDPINERIGPPVPTSPPKPPQFSDEQAAVIRRVADMFIAIRTVFGLFSGLQIILTPILYLAAAYAVIKSGLIEYIKSEMGK